MFSDELEHISWEETTARIHAKTDADVRRALSKEHCNVEDFMALISPAAAPYLETAIHARVGAGIRDVKRHEHGDGLPESCLGVFLAQSCHRLQIGGSGG